MATHELQFGNWQHQQDFPYTQYFAIVSATKIKDTGVPYQMVQADVLNVPLPVDAAPFGTGIKSLSPEQKVEHNERKDQATYVSIKDNVTARKSPKDNLRTPTTNGHHPLAAKSPGKLAADSHQTGKQGNKNNLPKAIDVMPSFPDPDPNMPDEEYTGKFDKITRLRHGTPCNPSQTSNNQGNDVIKDKGCECFNWPCALYKRFMMFITKKS